MDTIRQDVSTSHGAIAVEMTRGNGADVVLIHGNSSSRRVFHKQLSSVMFRDYRLICFDLPGHGESADALEKTRIYPLPGLAETAQEVLEKLGVKNPVLAGWSLGGHVAMEMLSHAYPMAGLFTIGAPAVGAVISEGFRGNLLAGLASQRHMTKAEAAQFVGRVFQGVVEPFMEEAAIRTDPEFRSTLFSANRRDEKSNQRDVVSSTKVPTAVINGADDTIVSLDYVNHVPYSNLWRNECLLIPGSAHAPFLQATAAFNHVLAEFLADVAGSSDARILEKTSLG